MFWFLLYIFFYFFFYFKANSTYIVSAILTILSALVASYLTIKIIKFAQVKRANILVAFTVKLISVIAILVVVIAILFISGTILDKYF